MTSPSARGDGRLPTLSSPNLRKLDSKLDKNHLLSYIRSQEIHLSHYVLEGKSVSASWGLEAAHTPPRKPAKDMELESGFGTPLLKPRVRTRLLQDQDANSYKRMKDSEQEWDARVAKQRRLDKKPHEASSRKTAKHIAASGSGSSDTEDHTISKQICTDDKKTGPLPQSAKRAAVTSVPKDKAAPRKLVQKSRREVEADEEHRNRLAERRERRRAKKAIVDPKPDPVDSDSSQEGEDNRYASRGKGSKKAKKERAPRIPAGLALMHAFSATNIGKNRLTLDSSVGVFSKGKASAKTTVKKTKTKPRVKLFSEELFLGKTATSKGMKNRHTSNTDVSAPESERSSPPTKSKKDISTELKKRKRSKLTAEELRTELDDQERRSCSPAQKKRKPERVSSPVWDIEFEDGMLPSGTGSDRSAPSEAGSKTAGTVLLDTRRYSSKWAVPDDKEGGRSKEKILVVAVPVVDDQHSDTPSIGPSNSASQAAPSGQNVFDGVMFSRYFPISARTPSERPIEDPAMQHRVHEPSPSKRTSHPQGVYERHEHCETDGDKPSHAEPTSSVPPAIRGAVVATQAIHERSPDKASSSPLALTPMSRLPSRGEPTRIESTALRHASCSSSLGLPIGPPSPASLGPVQLAEGAHELEDQDAYCNTGPAPPLPILAPRYVREDAMDQLDAIPHDWTAVAPGLFNDGLAPVFLSDVTALAHSVGDSVYLEDDAELAPEVLDDFPDFDTTDSGLYGVPATSRCVEALEAEYHTERYSEDLLYDQVAEDEGEEEPYEPPYPCDDELPYYNARSPAVDEQCRDVPFEDVEANLEMDFLVDLDSEDVEGSDTDQDPSVLGSLPRFSQGRALLLGVADADVGGGFRERTRVSKVEEDVAKSLRGHWLPQRF